MKPLTGMTILLAVLAAACNTPTAPDGQPPDRFGAITAVIDGRQWISSYFPDSVIAFYDPATRELQVVAQEVRPGGWPTFRLQIRTGAAPGDFGVGAYGDSISGAWLVPQTAERPHSHEGVKGYLSTGTPGDSLVIEELDLPQRVLRGRFRFRARLLHSSSEVMLVGRFAGRFLTPGP